MENYWAASVEEIVERLDTDPKKGLSETEVTSKLKEYGENKLREYKSRSVWKILFDQFKSLIIGLLFIAAIVSLMFGEHLDFWAIVVVIVISTMIGFFTEFRAIRSMEAIYKLGKVKTRVIRGGTVVESDAVRIVPGDIVVVEGGDIITADMRIIESSMLLADESSLTGESNPVEKQDDEIAPETILAERKNMLYKGTAVTRGSGIGVVIATGMDTELGTITKLVHEAVDEQTPLEVRLDKLGNKLILMTLAITVVIVIIGLLTGRELLMMIQTGVALAVATIPEGLPIVATIALANGVRKMADSNALITKMASVETLGATQVIFTDKTGTLTENRMTVSLFLIPDQQMEISEVNNNQVDNKIGINTSIQTAVEAGVLCNNATLSNQSEMKGTGDPLEVALLAAGEKMGFSLSDVLQKNPRLKEEAFNPEVKMMATWNKVDDQISRIYVKGAPDSVIPSCHQILVDGEILPFTENDKKKWEAKNEDLASQGLRLLALAYKSSDDLNDNPYQDLIFIGLVALIDPPRKDVKDAIEMCKKAGIRVIMVTGDQPATARFIAAEVGLENDEDAKVIHGSAVGEHINMKKDNSQHHDFFNRSIFARVTPAQKLGLIDMFQSSGLVVAMTGDGVNDAPALKKSDIGIAMGKRGSQVAREASDMVLTDDSFASIVTAIEQGRVIFGNIRNFIFYLMSCNISEVTVVAVAFIIGSPLPILPLQILFLNLVTDVFPALALGVGKGEKSIMTNPPRLPEEPLLTKNHWIAVTAYGAIITISVLSVLYIGLMILQLPEVEAVTLSFLTLAFSQLWHVFNMRSRDSGVIDNTVVKNPFVWGALVTSTVMLLLAVYIPSIADALSIIAPTATGWVLVLGFSLIPLLIGQTFLLIVSKGGK